MRTYGAFAGAMGISQQESGNTKAITYLTFRNRNVKYVIANTKGFGVFGG